MLQDTFVPVISHTIQLAVTPVFLLTGVAALLNVLVTRLARIIDRARQLEKFMTDMTGEHRTVAGDDIATLSTRARHVNRAIILCTSSALLVCTLVAVLFTSAFFERDASTIIAGLFISAMLCLIASLVTFMREILLATATLRMGKH
ncbi:MAG: DUF2721 domain-containing protein [Gemmatimonadaceae bacterium]